MVCKHWNFSNLEVPLDGAIGGSDFDGTLWLIFSMHQESFGYLYAIRWASLVCSTR